MGEQRQLATALYGRTSKDDPRRVTIEIQQRGLRDWAGRDALVGAVEEYWDDGVTGKTPLWERPQGRRLFESVKAGRLRCMAVMYSDRFGRTLLDGLLAVRELETLGVKLVAVHDGWDSRREDSPVYFQFRMMMAEEEHRRINQRTRDGKNRAIVRDGAPPSGAISFGYRMDSGGRLTIEPGEAAVVIHLFEMVLLGSTLLEMLAWLDTCGAPPGRRYSKRGGASRIHDGHAQARWWPGSVHRLLRNRIYAGERHWRDQTFPCPAIIDPDTFERVQAVLAGRRRAAPRRDPAAGYLSGLLTCAGCGARFYRFDGGAGYEYYQCKNATVRLGRPDFPQRKEDACRAKLLPISQCDEEVWKYLEAFIENPGDLLLKVCQGNERAGAEAGHFQTELCKVEDALREVAAEIAEVWQTRDAQRWPMAAVIPKINKLLAEQARLQASGDELRRRQSLLASRADDTARVAAALAGLRVELQTSRADPAFRLRVASLLLSEARVVTTGSGRRKSATIEFEMPWGERVGQALSGDSSVDNLPKTCPSQLGHMDSLHIVLPLRGSCQVAG